MNIEYKVEFFTYWHCGSGLSAGADVDALVVKDNDELPFVPGKTVKGLLREAMEYIAALKGTALPSDRLFGSPSDEGENVAGELFFSNAEFPDEDKKALDASFGDSSTKLKDHLYASLSRTGIDKDGCAKEHSLRKLEAVLPCTLTGIIRNVSDEYVNDVIDGLRFIKRLGANRNRGLGRCQFSVTPKK